MCKESAVVICVGYALPISCCLAGVGLSCFGCYRYYHATCLRYQRERELMSHAANGGSTQQQRIKRNTLKKKMIDAFFKSSKKSPSSSKNKEGRAALKAIKDTCPICIQEYDKDPSQVFIGLIKKCGHYFHFDCIWEWLERKRDCPICREACELSETDLRGLSLTQAMEMSCVEISIPSTSSKPIESNSSTLTSAGSLRSNSDPVVIVTSTDTSRRSLRSNRDPVLMLTSSDTSGNTSGTVERNSTEIEGCENGGYESDGATSRDRTEPEVSVVVTQPRSVHHTISIVFEKKKPEGSEQED